jgi:transposase InsO family protein
VLGRRRRRYPSLDAFASLAVLTETRQLAASTLRPIRYKTKAYDEVALSRGLVQREGPRRISSPSSIVCRFGVPSELTVDNGKQFDSQDFKDFCFSSGTKLAFASVYHPQSNGVVEHANGKIFTAVKKMLLDDKKSKWADLLPKAVWALNTTECRATGFTPFRLLYGSEVMTEREMCPWAISKCFGDLVFNKSA